MLMTNVRLVTFIMIKNTHNSNQPIETNQL